MTTSPCLIDSRNLLRNLMASDEMACRHVFMVSDNAAEFCIVQARTLENDADRIHFAWFALFIYSVCVCHQWEFHPWSMRTLKGGMVSVSAVPVTREGTLLTLANWNCSLFQNGFARHLITRNALSDIRQRFRPIKSIPYPCWPVFATVAPTPGAYPSTRADSLRRRRHLTSWWRPDPWKT